MSKSVWIAQCLCPARHCVLAAANEAETDDEAQAIGDRLRDAVAMLIRAEVLNPHCGLCGAGSETWGYELAKTGFASLNQAQPLLRQMEAEQRRVAQTFGDIHLTQRPN